MSSKECETQLNELLEAWDLDEATLNQTDIEAIKHLLLENQMQQDVIISYKTTNLDQAVDIQQLEQENNQLKEKINTYENPEDLTLMFMYCDEKAKDKIKQLKEVIEEVKGWLKYKAETLDEFDIPIRKESGAFWFSTRGEIDNLLQILDKVKENKK